MTRRGRTPSCSTRSSPRASGTLAAASGSASPASPDPHSPALAPILTTTTTIGHSLLSPLFAFRVPSTLLKILNDKFPETAVRFNAPVAKVLLSPSRDRATGVRLESGEEVLADVVVVNADLVYAAENLLDEADKGVKRIKALEKAAGELKGSCSSISLYWGMSKKISGLAGHSALHPPPFPFPFPFTSLPSPPGRPELTSNVLPPPSPRAVVQRHLSRRGLWRLV